MNVRIVPSLVQPISTLWKNLQSKYTKRGLFYVASPLSSTPIPIYEWIIDKAGEFENWNKVRFVLMDEMLEGKKAPFHYITIDDPASYEGFGQKHLLGPLSRKIKTSIKVVKPDALQIEDFETEIDLLILAMGIKGNYANVMPDTSINTGWHIAHLTAEFRQSHVNKGSQSYAGANFREYGMSLGHQQVLSAKNVALIISGNNKRELTKQLMSYNAFNPKFPLSIIYHPKVYDKVIIYITEDVSST